MIFLTYFGSGGKSGCIEFSGKSETEKVILMEQSPNNIIKLLIAVFFLRFHFPEES